MIGIRVYTIYPVCYRSHSEFWLPPLVLCLCLIFVVGQVVSADAGNSILPVNYQIPQLQFDASQEKIVVDNAISLKEENTTAHAAINVEMASIEDDIRNIPRGSIIHHSADGITTVFDKNGIQLFSAEDARAGLVFTPKGAKPATMVHELPSGSVLHSSGNTRFAVFNDEVILAEINEIPITTLGIDKPAATRSSDTFALTEATSALSATDLPSDRVIIEQVVLDYYTSNWNTYINRSSVQWKVPEAPKIVRPSKIQYLEFLERADDVNSFYVNGTKYYMGSFLYFVPVLEWNRYTNTWDMSTYIHNDNTSMPTYYSTGIPVHTGDLLTGEVIGRYNITDITGNRVDAEYWSVGISDSRGQTSNLSLVAGKMETVTASPIYPVELLLEISGDKTASSEENFVGDTTFSNFTFSNQKDVPIDPSSLSVWTTYVHWALKGKPGFMDMKIENNWPDNFVFRTQAEPVQAYTYSLTCIENYDNKGRLGGVFDECNNVASRLNATPGWKMVFYHKDDEVTPFDFGTSDDHHPSLADSTFYYHSGHGVDPLHAQGNVIGTIIMLKNYNEILTPPFYQGGIVAQDVNQKWGGKNKWVMLQSCRILSDRKWDNALTTSHGILGYSTSTNENREFPNVFFNYAIDQQEPIVTAYKDATMEVFNDPTIHGAVVVKTIDQYTNEQLPGVGYTAPDGDPGIKPIYRDWPCVSEG